MEIVVTVVLIMALSAIIVKFQNMDNQLEFLYQKVLRMEKIKNEEIKKGKVK